MDAKITGDDPPWLRTAKLEMGQREVRGTLDNPRILQYLRATHLPARLIADETPWCSAFVSFCLEQAGIRSTRSAAARSYLTWGKELDTPEMGCVAVLTREGDPGSGHVGFYVGAADNDVLLLGGNQGNAVSMRLYASSRVLSFRWPVVP